MKHYIDIITIDPQVRFGKPCIRGMRISVSDILGWLASGMTEMDILHDYPELTEEDIKAAPRIKRLLSSSDHCDIDRRTRQCGKNRASHRQV